MSSRINTRFDVVIVGAGLAGASVAYFLSKQKNLSVLVLEKELEPGRHSSGRSASLIRSVCGHPEVDSLAAEGTDFLLTPPPGFGELPVRPTGSYFLMNPSEAKRLGSLPGAEDVDLSRACREVPLLQATENTRAVFTARDGVLEVSCLLEGFLRGARRNGVVLRTGEELQSVEIHRSRVCSVRTSLGIYSTGAVVDAAGAWAGDVADQAAGLAVPSLLPARRHLFVLQAKDPIPETWPYVWDLDRNYYFRPEGGGLLVCLGDNDPDSPRDCPRDPAVKGRLSQRVQQHLPGLGDFRVVEWWAGHRTKDASGKFLLGPDRDIDGWFWAAGLGGHGVTCSPAVGRRVAEAIVRGALPRERASGTSA